MRLKPGDKIKITSLNCGHSAYNKFIHMGIREGVLLEVISSQPFEGPTVFKLNDSEIAVGYGMSRMLKYEVIK